MLLPIRFRVKSVGKYCILKTAEKDLRHTVLTLQERVNALQESIRGKFRVVLSSTPYEPGILCIGI